MMTRILTLLLATTLMLSIVSCGSDPAAGADETKYAKKINPENLAKAKKNKGKNKIKNKKNRKANKNKAAAPKPKPIDTKSLTEIPTKTKLIIGSINGSKLSDVSLPLKVTKDLTLDGWAIDKNANLPAGAVYAMVNGNLFRTNYGFNRKDVATHLKNDALTKSGFKITIPFAKIPAGPGVIKFKVVTNDLKKYYNESEIYHFKYVK